MEDLKSRLHQQLIAHIQANMDAAQKAIESAKEARNNDTKSSAGDKYETGREMMQIEIDKAEFQLGKYQTLLRELGRIDQQKLGDGKIGFGSLVHTDEGAYYISIGLGKVIVDGSAYFAISLASPIGALVAGKRVGDTIVFQGRSFKIQRVD